MQPVVIGDAADAAAQKDGWIVGHFVEKLGLARTNDLEIKIWRYDSQPDYGKKMFTGTEFIVVEAGVLTLELQGCDDGEIQSVELHGTERQYIIIPPNYIKRVLVTSAPCYGVTVRWPSLPGTNVVK